MTAYGAIFDVETTNVFAANDADYPWGARMTTNGRFVSEETDPAGQGPARGSVTGACGVVRAAGEYRLVAIRPILAGDRLFQMEGDRTTRPSRYSVQIGEDLHIDLGTGYTTEEILDRYFWRFMNHGCDPNALITGEEVIALYDIEPWAAVTFDYNTTEWDMAEPFRCLCDSPRCLGTIRGFKHLTAGQRKRLHPLAAPHLIRQAAMESPLRTDSLCLGEAAADQPGSSTAAAKVAKSRFVETRRGHIEPLPPVRTKTNAGPPLKGSATGGANVRALKAR